ncbi:MAG: tetratricopeptide repeat protein, partial [Candidatus Omnitrophica bacterium]|nr:tetratricopeptide repeat protein [Candidatus Omnitrophota bacterium]
TSTLGFDGSRAAQAIGSTASSNLKSVDLGTSQNPVNPTIPSLPRGRNITIDSSQFADRTLDSEGPATPTQPNMVEEEVAAAAVRTSRSELPDPKTLKQQGIDAYHARDFSTSIATFRDYLAAYTEEEDAVRAWLGYALIQDRRYGEASKEFTTLLNSGNPELRADAHYYLGSIYEKQGNFDAAKVRWEQVIGSYPDTKAADKARKSLDQIAN